MYLIDTFKRYPHILQRVDELHELRHGGVQLPDYILHGEHLPERHLPLYDSRCCKHRDNNILHLIDEDTPCLLRLLELQRLHLHRKQVCLCVLPFHTSTTLAILKLYLLHGGDELVCPVLVDCLPLEKLIIQHLPATQEHGYPDTVTHTAYREHKEYEPVIDEQHDAEYDETEE